MFWNEVKTQKQKLIQMKASGELDRLQDAEYAVPFGAWPCSLPGGWDAPDVVAGRITCVNFDIVAKTLVQKTHRLATEAEIREFTRASRASYDALRREEELRSGKDRITVVEPLPAVRAK
jgi:hypothetical protein